MGLRTWAKALLYGPSATVSSSQIIPFPTPEPEHRTSWVFDSHIVTESAGSARGSGKNPQAVSLAWDEDRYGINGQPSWFGMTARERKETLLQVFLANPWASNCIDTIALYIISGGFTIEPKVPKPDKAQRKKIEQFLLRVNDDWDFNQYAYDQISDELIFGETFTEFTLRDKAPYRLYPIDNLTMDTDHDRYGRVLRYKQQLSVTSEVNYLDPKTIVRWWNPHKRAKVDPFSPLERIQDALLLDKKMVNWMTRFFQKGAKFDYYFKGLSDRDEADRFLTWAKQNLFGEKNAHVPPTLWGNADIGTLGGGGPVDIDFDKGLDRMLTIVLSAFHVPPSIACIAESGNRLTDMSDGQRKILQYIACDPRRHRFFEKFNWRLIYPFFGEDYYVSTRYADFRDDKALADVADTRIRNGSLLIDEVRQEMGREAYPDGAGGVAVIVTTKDVTPVARLKDLEDEQRATSQAAISTAQANADLAATKAKQAKEPPQPVPPALQNVQQGVATNATDKQADDKQNPEDDEKKPPKSGNKAAKNDAKQESATLPAAKARLTTALQSFWLAHASRAAAQVEAGTEPLVAYSFTPAEHEQLTELLATAYSDAKVQAYSRAMTTAKRDKSLSWQSVYHEALHRAASQAQSISMTYRNALASALSNAAKESVEEGVIGGMQNVISTVGDWLKGFLGWKAPQVANSTVGSGANAGTDQAITDLVDEATDPYSDTGFDNPSETLRVRCNPDNSSNDFCADYAGNDYSLDEYLSLGVEFPAHPGCIHEWEVYAL